MEVPKRLMTHLRSSGSEISTSDSDSDSDSQGSTSPTDDSGNGSEDSKEEEERLEKLLQAARLSAQNRSNLKVSVKGTSTDVGHEEDVLRLNQDDEDERREA